MRSVRVPTLAVIVALIVASAVTSCGAADETADPGRAASSTAVDRSASSAAEATGEDGPDSLTALSAAEVDRRAEAWAESAPDAYSYEITAECGCEWGGRYRVAVVDGGAVEVESLGEDAEAYRSYFGQSVDEMFAMFREAIVVGSEEGADGAGARAAFDPSGHPTAFAVRWGDGDGDGYTAEIRNFSVEPPGAIEPREERSVVLTVSNQSYGDPDVHVTIEGDDETIVDGSFDVGNQHVFVGYEIDLPPGTHALRIASDSGAEATESIDVGTDGPTYVTVTYWGGGDGEPPSFNVQAGTERPGFG